MNHVDGYMNVFPRVRSLYILGEIRTGSPNDETLWLPNKEMTKPLYLSPAPRACTQSRSFRGSGSAGAGDVRDVGDALRAWR